MVAHAFIWVPVPLRRVSDCAGRSRSSMQFTAWTFGSIIKLKKHSLDELRRYFGGAVSLYITRVECGGDLRLSKNRLLSVEYSRRVRCRDGV